LPTVVHVFEDLGYDLYASENRVLKPGQATKVPTGIAVEFVQDVDFFPNYLSQPPARFGGLICNRSSVGSKGTVVTGGVVDAGYRGEVVVVLLNITDKEISVAAGDKIAQIIPIPVRTGFIVEVEELSGAERGEKSFGSSGV